MSGAGRRYSAQGMGAEEPSEIHKEEWWRTMDGLVIGLALCDSYTQVNCGGQEKVWAFPTVICRKKNEDMWAYLKKDIFKTV